MRRIALVTVLALGLVLSLATPATAWHEGSDPEYPRDPRPHEWKEIVADGTCHVKQLAQLPC